ncbi:MAG: FAD-dependent oxidoreductase [Candidatus Cloacimonetes bacterium]|nr:FAD-dependent oxidoreductase [Candidatus Cloacimonadota bacterium]
MKIVIIGTGLAGYTLVREIRKVDQEIEILMITKDNGSLYSKPMLSNALSKNKDAEQLIQSSAKQMEDKYQIQILTHTKVLHIDSDNNLIHLDNKKISYDSLVLAIGANPFRPKLEGSGADNVLSINNLRDYQTYREGLDHASSVAIIGPGLIGCEFANDLISQDKEIHVIGPDPYAMSNLLTKEAGEHLQNTLSKYKVNWHLSVFPIGVEKLKNQFKVNLDNGESVISDLVVSAVGLRANLNILKDSNILFDKAITCNQYLQTNISNVYALGDCAEVAGHYLPFVAPIIAGAKALSKTLTGTKTKVQYKANSVTVKTDVCPLVVAKPSVPHSTTSIEKDDSGIKVVYYDDKSKVLGYILMGVYTKEKLVLNKTLPDLMLNA